MKVQKISNTIQKFDGVSYYLCGKYFQRKGVRLHRTVWEYHNGLIPKDYDVHHIDGDRTNNDISNLQLLPGKEHGRLHMKEPQRIEQSKKHIEIAREAASKWHGSPAGAEFHSRLAKQTWENAKPKTYICSYCGKEFQTKNNYGKGSNTFCCNAHKTAWRNKQGLDNETRICPVCGGEFTVNKYRKTVCCSLECAKKRRWRK